MDYFEEVLELCDKALQIDSNVLFAECFKTEIYCYQYGIENVKQLYIKIITKKNILNATFCIGLCR